MARESIAAQELNNKQLGQIKEFSIDSAQGVFNTATEVLAEPEAVPIAEATQGMPFSVKTVLKGPETGSKDFANVAK